MNGRERDVSGYPRVEMFKGELAPPSILTIMGDEEILRFEKNGDIYVKGKLIVNDMEVVEGFREFLKAQGFMR